MRKCGSNAEGVRECLSPAQPIARTSKKICCARELHGTGLWRFLCIRLPCCGNTGASIAPCIRVRSVQKLLPCIVYIARLPLLQMTSSVPSKHPREATLISMQQLCQFAGTALAVTKENRLTRTRGSGRTDVSFFLLRVRVTVVGDQTLHSLYLSHQSLIARDHSRITQGTCAFALSTSTWTRDTRSPRARGTSHPSHAFQPSHLTQTSQLASGETSLAAQITSRSAAARFVRFGAKLILIAFWVALSVTSPQNSAKSRERKGGEILFQRCQFRAAVNLCPGQPGFVQGH